MESHLCFSSCLQSLSQYSQNGYRIANYLRKLRLKDMTIDEENSDIAVSLFFADFPTNCYVDKLSNNKVSE